LEAQKLEVERRNRDLEMRLADMEARNAMLQSELEKLGGRLGMNVFRSPQPSSPAATEHLRHSPAPPPVTFSQELFGSQDGDNRPISTQSIVKPEPSIRTVNPASLSPEIRPIESSNASFSDMTQHPAVSVRKTTALDNFDNGFNISDISNNALDEYDFSGLFNPPEPNGPDNFIFENGVAPLINAFDNQFDPLVNYNAGELDDFSLDDFLHNDDQPAPEIQSSDSLAETTASLQPQLGASTHGCDDGGNAVSV
jgi:transcriptional activator HAC1